MGNRAQDTTEPLYTEGICPFCKASGYLVPDHDNPTTDVYCLDCHITSCISDVEFEGHEHG